MTGVGDFRRRADREARRYGGDRWVFIRELLQNARDAGARTVRITIEQRADRDRIVLRDDGCGMTFEHARRYLFTLYATSKADQDDRAGRFGIGFWSVLRFDPDEVTVRSRPDRGRAWQLRFSGDLHRTERSAAEIPRGTEIELTRAARGVELEDRVWRAVRRDARHLRRLGSDAILDVRVNARRATGPIDLPPPSLLFGRRGLRGGVGLSDTPRVDLLAHGLRVRTAATLDELLTEPERPGLRRPPPGDGLAPRVVVDSRRLQVLMARGDARTDSELRRAVDLGRRAVRRLVRGQLDRAAGLGPIGRAVGRCSEIVEQTRTRWLVPAVAVIAAGAAAGAWLMIHSGSRDAVLSPVSGPGGPGVAATSSAVLQASAAERYLGPTVERLRPSVAAVDLTYLPASSSPLLTVMRVRGIDSDGRVVPHRPGRRPPPAEPAPCASDCLDMSLVLRDTVGAVRLPVATGHRLTPSSVTTGDAEVRLGSAADGVPLVLFDRPFTGRVRYRTGPTNHVDAGSGGSWPTLPPEGADIVARLRGLDPDRAARLGERWVGRRVASDTSSETVVRHRQAARDGLGFIDRCLSVGAGDCDVQNALLATVLHRAGFDVRLAVGLVGAGGRARPGLHAWVELRARDGSWRTADASGVVQGPDRPEAVEGASASEQRPPGHQRTAVPVRPSDGELAPRRGVWAAAVILLVAMAAAATLRRRLTVHDVRWSDDPDVGQLVRGALERPDAFRDAPAVFSRSVVPLLDGGAIGLDRARKLARRRRLSVTTEGSDLAVSAARRGRPVLDARRDEAAVVAGVLGAIDLDRWQRLLDTGRTSALADGLAAALGEVGARCRVLVSSGVPDGTAVLPGELAGPDGATVIAVDENAPLWRRIRDLATDRPRAAVLVLAEWTVHGIAMPSSRRRQLLRRLAADALAERAGVGT